MSTQAILLKDSDTAKVQQEAQSTIQRISSTDSTQLDSLMDEIGRMGQRTMEKAGANLTLLERPLNDLLNGKRSEIAGNIMKLRNEVDDLNRSKDLSLMQKILRKTPMKNYIMKYQSVKTNVNAIISALRNGKDTLEENIVHMRNLKQMCLTEMYNVQQRIELGNQLRVLFEQEIAKPENESRKAQLERGLRKVVTRIQAFTEMIMLYQQAIAGSDIINDNNDKLIDSVDATIDKTQHLITVSAMIATALDDQLKVIDAVNATNEMLGKQFAENARLLNETTQKTTQAMTKSAMSMEQINQAMNDLTSAITRCEESNRTIISSATEQTARLTEINKQMGQRLGLNSGKSAAATPAAIQEPAITSLLD
ncbi:toxic anion resistance protein [Cohnella sp. WQ 127256]|uniref:toxic anion resistance protein n=1 Tax=Cohnella sp. WQ 127256 TaxID=2938790 RepID=UPI002118B441|nr:toxic anion resistance protein [Cohnella sp. WQ 127256]